MTSQKDTQKTEIKISKSELIRNYILFNLENPDKTATDDENLLWFYEDFKRVSNYSSNVRRFPIESHRMADYLLGLPSGLSIAFTYHDIDSLGEQWGYIGPKSRQGTIENWRNRYWQVIAESLLGMIKGAAARKVAAG
jgi:hypothetical protein